MQGACSSRGTYNPVLLRCTCPIGWSGPSCEVAALQACRLYEKSNLAVCTVRRPQHCECLNQCEALGAFSPHFNPYCFERPQHAAHSTVPSHEDRAAVYRHWSKRKAVGASEALAVEFMPGWRHVPHALCIKECSGRGACISDISAPSRPPWCKCDSYYTGRACERSTTPYCWNDCLGRGTCTDGYCQCRPPYFGPGCAYESSHLTPPAAPRFRVHVYDLDPIVLRRVNYGSDPDPIFNTYHTFVRALLADGASLTPRPEAADLLLAPAFGTNMEQLVEYYEHAQEHLARHYPAAWRRYGGADHFWLISGDGGGCDLHRLPALRRSIRVAHYLKLNHSRGRHDTCGDEERDVSLPPEVPAIERPTYLARGTRPMDGRQLTFFFAGNVPDKSLVDTTSDDALGREGYSEGVRQIIWKHHRHRTPAYRIVERSTTCASTNWNPPYVTAPRLASRPMADFVACPVGAAWQVQDRLEREPILPRAARCRVGGKALLGPCWRVRAPHRLLPGRAVVWRRHRLAKARPHWCPEGEPALDAHDA